MAAERPTNASFSTANSVVVTVDGQTAQAVHTSNKTGNDLAEEYRLSSGDVYRAALNTAAGTVQIFHNGHLASPRTVTDVVKAVTAQNDTSSGVYVLAANGCSIGTATLGIVNSVLWDAVLGTGRERKERMPWTAS